MGPEPTNGPAGAGSQEDAARSRRLWLVASVVMVALAGSSLVAWAVFGTDKQAERTSTDAPTTADSSPDAGFDTLAPSTPEKTACIDGCETDVAFLVAGLEQKVCKSVDSYMSAQEDVLRDVYGLEPDLLLGCTAGGSMDTSGMGSINIWHRYADLEAHLDVLRRCDAPGVTVYGEEPDGLGYAVVGIQSGPDVVQSLKDGGAAVLRGG